jgi:hypothetical protein
LQSKNHRCDEAQLSFYHSDDAISRNYLEIVASLMMARQKWEVERSDQKNAGHIRWCYVLGSEQYTQ